MNSPRHTLVLAGLLLAAFVVAAGATEPPGATILGSGFVGDPFVVEGDIVLESNSLYETLRDYSAPQAPRVLGWIDHAMDGYWTSFVSADGLAVGLTGPQPLGLQGFAVCDVADPAEPAVLGALSGMGFESGWLRGRALSACTDAIMVTYDLTVPSSPALASFALLGTHAGSRWPGETGDRLYLIDHAATLGIYDVADALHPTVLGSAALAGDRIDAMAVADGVLYALVAVDVGGAGERLDLVTCSLAAPAAVLETDRQTLFSGAAAAGRSLVAADDLLVCAAGDGQVRAFGLADPAHPQAGWVLAHDGGHLAVSTSALFIREGGDLLIYARTPWDTAPTAPLRRSELPLLRAVVGQGPVQIAQLVMPPYGMRLVDVSDLYVPRLGGPFALEDEGDFQFVDGLGLAGSGYAVRLYDLSDPEHPAELGHFTGPTDGPSEYKLVTRTLAAAEHRVYPLGDYSVHLFDLTDPALPLAAAVLAEHRVFGGDDRLLACGDDDGARIYDISDLDAPQELGSLPDPGTIAEIRFWRGHAFSASTHGGTDHTLDAYDVADGAAPTLAASRPLPRDPWALNRHGNRLYIQGYKWFVVFDVTNPADPRQIGDVHWINSAGSGFAINGNVTTVSGDLIMVRNDGLSPSGVDPSVALSRIVLQPAFPNPCNPATRIAFTVDREQELVVSVHDVRGRRVAELAAGTFGAGPHELTWGGVDGSGTPVASGVYLVRLRGPGVEALQPVTLLK